MTSSLRIIVTGLIGQHYHLPGVSWDYIQYALGLHRMGHDVYYIEDSGEWPYTLDGGPVGNQWVAVSCEPNICHLKALFTRFGMEDRWAYFFPYEKKWYGMDEKSRKEVIATADIVLNVSGTLQFPERYGDAAKLVYIDSDPGFTQLKLLRGDVKFCRRVAAHDIHFSFGESLPEPLTEKLIYNWVPTRTPIVMKEWRQRIAHKGLYSTVMNWTSYPPVEWGNYIFSQKDSEFIRFVGLPSVVHPLRLQVAMSGLQHANWQIHLRSILSTSKIKMNGFDDPAGFLSSNGWEVVDPMAVCGNIDSYRNYIKESKGEWSVAKGGYVSSRAGWFSCRSACYLAAGRPVIVQDTGFSSVLPCGEGILPFRTVEEAVQALQEVEGNYRKHSRMAVEIAENYFAAEKVLQQLIDNTFMGRERKHMIY